MLLLDWITHGFVPKYHCSPGWTPAFQAWAAASEILVAIAYFGLPRMLIRAGRGLEEIGAASLFGQRLIRLFAAFILACGASHLMGAIVIWWPAEPLRVMTLTATAAVSLYAFYRLPLDVPLLFREISKTVSESALVDRASAAMVAIADGPIGYAIVAYEGQWLSVNAEVERITGYTSSELTSGKTWMDITVRESLEIDSDLVRKVKSGEIAYYSLEKEYRRPGGDRAPVRIWVRRTKWLGDPAFSVWIQDMRDFVRLRARQDEKLAQAQNDLAKSRESVATLRGHVDALSRRSVDDGLRLLGGDKPGGSDAAITQRDDRPSASGRSRDYPASAGDRDNGE